jgi:acyl-CoA synthetase (NDP forming)
LLAIEHTDATARAVRSHTGALATDGATIDAACRAAGIERVRSPQELVDVAAALLDAPRPRGRRVAVVADGGGHGGVAAALAHGAGLDVPALSDSLAGRIRAMLPPSAAVANPIDLAGGGEQDVSCFGRIVDALLESAEVDAVLLTGYFGGYAAYASDFGEQESAAAQAMAAAAAASGRPLIVHSMHETGAALTALRSAGVPVYDAIERAVGVLGRLAAARDRPATGVPPLPPAAPPATDTGYAAVRALLAAGGVPFVAAETVTTTADAFAAATRLSYPVVLKALGALHKSDGGGVVLGIADEAQLRTAVDVVARRLAPPAMSVERMAPLREGIELIAGCRWDERFGPVVMVGIGGIHTETLADVGLALAPIDEDAADRLLHALRGAPLLLGARGRVPLDVRAAARAVAALSRVAAAHPELAEIEVNPLLVTATGALGLDARAISFAASGSL